MAEVGAKIVSGESVSVLIARKVKKGFEERFWALEKELFDEVEKIPGFLTVNHFPTTAGEDNEYVSVLQFDGIEALLRWERSEARNRILEEIQEALEYEPRRKSITGLEGMFSSATQAGPPRWKMSVVLSVMIFLMIVILRPLVNQVLPDAPSLLQMFVTISVQVPLLTYLVMPQLTKALSSWLYKK
jgi:antibiotic biosynthesis monooxygenase (ABM) superfamily enzyme